MLALRFTSTDKLQLTTSAASATGVVVVVHYVETDESVTDASAMVPGRQTTRITTATTTDILGVPNSGKVRNVKGIDISNMDATLSNTVTPILNANGTLFEIKPPCTLLARESWTRNDEGTWFHYDAIQSVYSTGGSVVDPGRCDFRLSGLSATPIMTADSTTLSNLFLAEHRGHHISLFDGSNWQDVAPAAEISLAVTGRTADLPVDVFGFLSGGVLTMELLNWATAAARATALARLDGVLVKAGDATRRWLGSFRPRSATTFHWVRNGDDLPCKFDLFNASNRMDFGFALRALVNTWAYATATIRQAQASANYQVDIMNGIQEECFGATLSANSSTATTTINRGVAIGFDSTTAFLPGSMTGGSTNSAAVAAEQQSVAHCAHQPTIGSHKYTWLEYGGTGVTFLGDNGALFRQSGMTGYWTC